MFNWLIFSWAFTFGFNPIYCEKYVDNYKQTYSEQVNYSFYEDMNVCFTMFNHIQAYGGMKCYNTYSNMYFNPWQLDSKIGAKLYLYKVDSVNNIYLSIDHECIHPIYTDKNDISHFNFGTTNIGITIKGEIK